MGFGGGGWDAIASHTQRPIFLANPSKIVDGEISVLKHRSGCTVPGLLSGKIC